MISAEFLLPVKAAASPRFLCPELTARDGGWDGEAPSLSLFSCRIKRQKENQRQAEEQRMQELAEQREPSPGEGTWEALAQLQLEERRARDRQQREKEHMRYSQCELLGQTGCRWQR